MAKLGVFVPDGEYCSDKSYLGCKFDQAIGSQHYCLLYEKFLGSLETLKVEDQTVRARHKCNACINDLKDDSGNGFCPNS